MYSYNYNHDISPFKTTRELEKYTSLFRNIALLIGSGLILCMLLAGCKAQTKVLKAPVEITKTPIPRSVAIFPLADYSQRKPFIASYRDPNLLIIEEITQNLVGYGFNVSIQEDVNDVLISEKILMPVPVKVQLPAKVLKKLAKPNKDAYGRWHGVSYNPPQLEEIKEINEKEILEKLNKELEKKHPSLHTQGVKGLDQETVTKLAQRLNVDIIFRGRILEYGFKDNDTLNPIEGAGLLTFLIDEPKRFLFGVTSRNKYDTVELIRDTVESMVIGGAVGGGIGAAANGAELGSAIGGGLGLLRAGKRPPVESSVMHIRLYAQDGKTGQIIWTNAIEVEREPISRFAFDEKHPKVLLDKLTREGIQLLAFDFAKNTGIVILPAPVQEAPIPEESQQPL